MIISDCSVKKVDKNDPRYPDAASMKRADGTLVEFSDVYLCECTTVDGEYFNSPFYITPMVGAMTPATVATMLKLFADAVARMGEAKAA